MLFIIIGQLLAYLSISFLIGAFILTIIPEDKRPHIYVPKKFLYIATAVGVLATFLPVLQAVSLLSSGLGFWSALTTVLFSVSTGQVWLVILCMAISLVVALAFDKEKIDKITASLGLLFTFSMILGLTIASHAATTAGWLGYLFHNLHFFAVSIWIGILLVVSWFSVNKENWGKFLKWFTPLAIISLVIVVISGYFITDINIASYENPNATIFQEYSNGLAVNYGQALLIKHLFFFAVILFAVFNGILFRKKQSDPTFNPLKWTKVESAFALIVFAATAFIGQSSPPHQISNLSTSPMFEAFNDESVVQAMQQADEGGFQLTFSFGMNSILLFTLGLLFLGLAIFAAVRRQSAWISGISALFMVIAAYFGIMIGIEYQEVQVIPDSAAPAEEQTTETDETGQQPAENNQQSESEAHEHHNHSAQDGEIGSTGILLLFLFCFIVVLILFIMWLMLRHYYNNHN